MPASRNSTTRPEGPRWARQPETVAREYDISRGTGRVRCRSQQRAVEATEAGTFDDEIVPIETDDGIVTEDEGLRPGTTAEKIAGLPPAFEEEGTVTAANASQVSDGAAGVLITSEEFAEEQDLEIMAEIGDHNVAGVDPTVMGIGPVPAVRGIWGRNGRSADDYDLVELNEAFASQTIYCRDELGFDDDSFNANGGRSPSATRWVPRRAPPVTLIHELQRRGGGRASRRCASAAGKGAAVEFNVD